MDEDNIDDVSEAFISQDDVEKEIDLDDDDVEIVQNDGKIDDSDDDLDMEEIVDDSIGCFTCHEDAVLCCDVSHDDRLVVTGGQDDKAFVWDAATQKTVFTIDGHKDSVVAVKFNKNSTLLATGDYSGFIQVWNNEGQRLYDYEVDDLNWMLWHPIAENVLLAGTTSGDAWMWKLSKTNPQCKTIYSPGSSNVTAKIFDDGKRIVMGYENGSVSIWDLKSIEVLGSITGHQAHKDSVISLDLNEENSLVASGSTDSTVKIINVNTYKVLMTLSCGENKNEERPDSIEGVAFSTNNLLAVGSVNGCIQIWDLSAQNKRNELKLDYGVSKISISKSNPFILYAGCLDAVFRLIDIRTCQVLSKFTGHTNQILDFCISSDHKYALSCSEDSTCKIFQLTQ